MQNSMILFTFFAFNEKYPFRINFIQKMKIVSLSSKLVASLIEYAEVNDAVQVFHFRQEISFLRKLGQINKNYQFKLKVST